MSETDKQPVAEIRHVGRLPGRYALPARMSASEVSVFSCLTQSISSSELVISAPVSGALGDPAAANIDEIGIIKGTISRLFEGGLAIAVDPRLTDIENLVRRIEWHRRKARSTARENRGHKRFIPRHTACKLLVADGRRLDGLILDLSQSGIAVSADVSPIIGEPMAVGAIVGRVARIFEGGFALKFLEIQDLEQIEHHLNRLDIDSEDLSAAARRR